MRLPAEESILLLTCRPYLSDADSDHLNGLVKSPKIDWPFVLWRAEAYRTTSTLGHHLKRLGLEEAIPSETLAYLQTWKTLSEAHLLAYYRELGFILSAFDSAGIDHFLTKGCALGQQYYPEPLVRSMQDLDIMIHPHDAYLAQRTMFELGYTHDLWNPSTNAFEERSFRVTPESLTKYNELPAFAKCVRMRSPLPKSVVPWVWRRKYIKSYIDENNILTIPVFVDVHVNLSEGIDLTDVWRGSQREEVLGRLVRVHSPTGMLWFIAARVYHEAFQYSTLKLQMFGDAHAIIYKRGSDVDWTEIVTVAKKYGMHPALFYVFSQLKKIAGSEIPDPVTDFLRPDSRGFPSLHDWGDVIPKLMNIPVLESVKLA
jgi:hypothetical protein